jgi:hypothetical protein
MQAYFYNTFADSISSVCSSLSSGIVFSALILGDNLLAVMGRDIVGALGAPTVSSVF